MLPFSQLLLFSSVTSTHQSNQPSQMISNKKKKIQFSVDNQIVQHVVGYAAADINIFILNTLKCNMWETFHYKIYET